MHDKLCGKNCCWFSECGEMAGKIDVDTDRYINTCTYNIYIIYRWPWYRLTDQSISAILSTYIHAYETLHCEPRQWSSLGHLFLCTPTKSKGSFRPSDHKLLHEWQISPNRKILSAVFDLQCTETCYNFNCAMEIY